MEKNIHKAEARGKADHGWLKSRHTFSFANYHNPKMMGFNTLRVINDDIVHPAKGFGTHPHRDMEIISIPLRGSLRHEDSMGNKYVIKNGEVQVMSAGTGITHSEFNNSNDEDVNFLQIWVMPKNIGVKPNYEQKHFSKESRKNKLQLVVSPDGRSESNKINQDAFFTLVDLDKEKEIAYNLYNKGNGVYIFIIEGSLDVSGVELTKRDGLTLENIEKLALTAKSSCEILIMEVPA